MTAKEDEGRMFHRSYGFPVRVIRRAADAPDERPADTVLFYLWRKGEEEDERTKA